MSTLAAVEIKAFVPARDFALSKQFYQDLGFDLAWSDDDLAYMRCGNSSFLLTNFYHAEHAGNFMMHLLVTDVEAWWRHVQAQGIASKYDTKAEPPKTGLGTYATSCLSIPPASFGASGKASPRAERRRCRPERAISERQALVYESKSARRRQPATDARLRSRLS